jgi:hypothetical protein
LIEAEDIAAGIAEARRDLRRIDAEGCTISPPEALTAITAACASSTMI